jgi:hypothetical protein
VNQSAAAGVVCPHCGAENNPYSRNCWICQRSLAPGKVVTAELVKPERPAFAVSELTFMVLTIGLAAALVMAFVGLWQQAPGAGVALFIFLTPVIIATLVRGQKREAKQGFLTWQDRFVVFSTSLVLAIGLTMLALFSAIAAVFLICLGTLPWLSQ